jgi:hypothetical protein
MLRGTVRRLVCCRPAGKGRQRRRNAICAAAQQAHLVAGYGVERVGPSGEPIASVRPHV